MAVPATNERLAFGLYEVDLQTGELWKAGFRVKLQSQPFKVLTALLERPGHVVTREELQHRLWGRDTVVDFDHSLGTAINKIREALGDSAENPRFIETLSRRGYRFIAPVGPVHSPNAESMAAASAPAPFEAGVPDAAHSAPVAGGTASPVLSGGTLGPIANATGAAALGVERHPVAGSAWVAPRRRYGWMAAVAVALCAIAAGYLVGSARAPVAPPHISQITRNGHISPGAEHMEDLAESATDGFHLFTSTIDGGQSALVAVSLAGGAVVPVPTPAEVASPALGDLSPDGSKLLLRNHLSPESEQPLWVVPTVGGSALRVGNVLAHDAAWMPDGEGILYATGNELYLTGLTEAHPKLYATLPGRAFWLRWRPGGKLLRFTLIDPIAHTMSLWQLGANDPKPRRVLNGWTEPGSECCGVWTADGRSFIFQSGHGGNTDLWRMPGDAADNPVRLTDGPLRYQAPVTSPTGSKVYFVGVDARSEMKRLSNQTHQLEAQGDFLSTAIRVDYSRDGKWVCWTDDAGLLWRARTDGSERLQLTPGSLDVFMARWSPDGQSVAVMGREAGKAWQIYKVAAAGGQLEPLLQENRNAADPSWGPYGQRIVFGRTNDMMGKEPSSRGLQILDLKTHQIEAVPGSENLFSPRWSPDGQYIAALSLDQRQVHLYTVATRTWRALPVGSGADPIWSADSRSIYVHARLEASQPIERISIPDGSVEVLIRLARPSRDGAVDFVLGGLTPENQPLIRERLFTGNVYSLDLAAKRDPGTADTGR